MRDLKKILLAVDLLEPNTLSVEYVSALANKFNSEVTAIYVTPPTTQYARYAAVKVALDKLKKEIEDEALQSMKKFIEKISASFPTKPKGVIIEGGAAKEIVNFAKNNDINLIVMGTRGKTGLEGMLLGSVASKVIKMSPVPVFTVNPENNK